MSSMQVLAGFHAVTARLRHAPGTVKEIYTEQSRRDRRMQSLVALAQAANLRVIAVPPERLDGLAKGVRHQGVVALAQPAKLAVDIDEVLDTLEDTGATPLLLV